MTNNFSNRCLHGHILFSEFKEDVHFCATPLLWNTVPMSVYDADYFYILHFYI